MDFISHALTANLASIIINQKYPEINRKIVLIGGIIPDIGEILIQSCLSKKYNVSFGVYDVRTSDIFVASKLSVTWLYDTLHSPILIIIILLLSFIMKQKIKYLLGAFAIGLFFHILLDIGTHGKIWSLKLFFPFSNQRYPVLNEILGNWWEWTPKIPLYFVSYGFPLYNIIYIISISIITYIFQKYHVKLKKLK